MSHRSFTNTIFSDDLTSEVLPGGPQHQGRRNVQVRSHESVPRWMSHVTAHTRVEMGGAWGLGTGSDSDRAPCWWESVAPQRSQGTQGRLTGA